MWMCHSSEALLEENISKQKPSFLSYLSRSPICFSYCWASVIVQGTEAILGLAKYLNFTTILISLKLFKHCRNTGSVPKVFYIMTKGYESKYMVKQKENIIWPICDERTTSSSNQTHTRSPKILLEIMCTGHLDVCIQFFSFRLFSKCWEKWGLSPSHAEAEFFLFLWVMEREFSVLLDYRQFTCL